MKLSANEWDIITMIRGTSSLDHALLQNELYVAQSTLNRLCQRYQVAEAHLAEVILVLMQNEIPVPLPPEYRK